MASSLSKPARWKRKRLIRWGMGRATPFPFPRAGLPAVSRREIAFFVILLVSVCSGIFVGLEWSITVALKLRYWTSSLVTFTLCAYQRKLRNSGAQVSLANYRLVAVSVSNPFYIPNNFLLTLLQISLLFTVYPRLKTTRWILSVKGTQSISIENSPSIYKSRMKRINSDVFAHACFDFRPGCSELKDARINLELPQIRLHRQSILVLS